VMINKMQKFVDCLYGSGECRFISH
jgi:hypothetical protein